MSGGASPVDDSHPKNPKNKMGPLVVRREISEEKSGKLRGKKKNETL